MTSVSELPHQPTGLESLSPRFPSGHARKYSRNRNSAPLPSFTFNPGAVDSNNCSVDMENQPPTDLTSIISPMRRASKPPPLPEFKFNPGGEISSPAPISPTHPVLEEMALNQQRVSRSAKPAPIPIFTFNSGATTPQPIPSPTRSESGDTDGQKIAGGHRRSVSEFVGGGLDTAHLLNTSPQKHESKPSGPPISNSTFRGHNHRRSQAISISDIDTSDLIKTHAVAKSRAGSQPSTPGEVNQSFSFPMQSPLFRGTPITGMDMSSNSPRRRESAPGARPRTVDFSEKIDVIPRPLSMISSETEGSCSTVRGGHSLSGSINSLASFASPVRGPSVVSSPIMDGTPSRRPKTADPSILMGTGLTSEPEVLPSQPKRPLSSSGLPSCVTSDSPPLKKKHFWSSTSPDTTPTATPKAEVSDPFGKVDLFVPSEDVEMQRPKTSPEHSLSPAKRRKYHTWTAGIFSKKSRHRSSKMKTKRTPTPPALLRRDSEKLNQIFDADDTIVLREDSPLDLRKEPAIYDRAWSVPFDLPSSEEVTSPVIDLDAALDSFESDEHPSTTSNRTAASRIAKLHSSERRGFVDAFGVVHRRTESAPSMPAVNRTLFGMQRYGGSNASLGPDVFDEEEEDNFLADQQKSKSEDGASVKQVEGGLHGSMPRDIKKATEAKSGYAQVHDPSDSVIIFDPEQAMTADDNRSSKSTLEPPTIIEDDLPKRPSTAPMPFAYSIPQYQYASSTEVRATTATSLVSSSDADQLCFDSSQRFRRFGEGNPDFDIRPSTDDLPSLSDSISSVVPRISSSVNTRSSTEQRSQSMFIASTSKSQQNWKRSSLASLNKLIQVGSANGSKLKFEAVPDNTVDDKTKKKSNRISRLMRFWKSKETP